MFEIAILYFKQFECNFYFLAVSHRMHAALFLHWYSVIFLTFVTLGYFGKQTNVKPLSIFLIFTYIVAAFVKFSHSTMGEK